EDDEVGTVSLDQFAHERADPRDELGLAATVIGKEGIVGDVDVARIGPRLDDLAKNCEAAEPGIEDEDGGRHGGCWYERNGRRAMAGAGGARRPRAAVAALASCGSAQIAARRRLICAR